MAPIDWQDLYASNQAAIRAAGVPALAPAGMPPRMKASPAPRLRSHLPALPAPGVPARRPGMQHDALVHVPAGLDPTTAVPLVCMLHGCTQNAESFAAATRMNAEADRHGFVVVYPRQSQEANAQRCWNWFLPEHQERGAGEPAAIAATLRRLLGPDAKQAVDPARVFVAGLSSGGAMAAVVAYAYPDLVAAFAVHSGIAYRAATSMPAAFAAMSGGGADPTLHGGAAHAAMGQRARPVPSMVVHGTEDPTVAPVNAAQVLGQSMAANALAAPGAPAHDPARPTETETGRGRQAGGHAFTTARWRDDESGAVVHESLTVHGMGHAWSGGTQGGSHTDPRGPSATEAIWRFFAQVSP
jgi:poly(hydroxyalkanoate) depolymerase family esterase